MEIKSQFKNSKGFVQNVVYKDGEPPSDLEMNGVHAYCFYGDKFVVVYNHKKDYWTPPGGRIENGESWSEAAVREVKEESNMKVLYQKCIGYIVFTREDGVEIRQPRVFCIVEPYGEFIADEDAEGDITEIKFIYPEEYKHYFDWGEIGDHVIKQALELKRNYIAKS